MNIIADIGNTSTKLALFDGKKKVSVSRVNDLNCADLDKLLTSNRIERGIVSSVKPLPEFVMDLLFSSIPSVHILTHKSKLPFRIEYETPETLGTDRIAAVAGAYQMHPGRNFLVIDAGTAITFDLLEGKNYKGGNISPGITMRFRALNHFTGNLPLITEVTEFTFPGRNTSDAITAGVITGVVYEINEYIRTFEEKHPGIKVVISGGDGGTLMQKLNYPAEYLPDIVIDGLNFILEYNAK
ncbi:MAG: type III pantothenate kinase [Chloroflexota bacterium]